MPRDRLETLHDPQPDAPSSQRTPVAAPDGHALSPRPTHHRPEGRATAKPQAFSRTDVNFWLDATLLVLFVALCALSVVLEFVFPPGPQAAGWLLLGRGYADWSQIRFGVLATLAAAILLHLMLHWNWVCGVVASRLGAKKKGATAHDDPTRTLWGVALLIVVCNVIGLAVAAAMFAIQAPAAIP
jgi:uncharacterized protein DUF4405